MGCLKKLIGFYKRNCEVMFPKGSSLNPVLMSLVARHISKERLSIMKNPFPHSVSNGPARCLLLANQHAFPDN